MLRILIPAIVGCLIEMITLLPGRSSKIILIVFLVDFLTPRVAAFYPLIFPRKHIQSKHQRTSRSMSTNEQEGDLSFDMDQLRSRIDQQQNQYYDLLMSQEEDSVRRPEKVHIIVFNPGTDKQGVHTIEFPKGSGFNIILAFESEDECAFFSQLLKQDSLQFYDPVPSESPLDQLEEFCEAMRVPVKVVPAGKNLRPPSDSVDDLSFNPNVGKERNKLNQLLDDDDDNDDDYEMASWQ